jgi:hypothetical protein
VLHDRVLSLIPCCPRFREATIKTDCAIFPTMGLGFPLLNLFHGYISNTFDDGLSVARRHSGEERECWYLGFQVVGKL